MKMNLNKSAYKIVFFGTPEFVSPLLTALAESFDVVKIFRQPLKFDDKTLSELTDLSADFFVVASFGQILPPKLLSIPKIAAVNIHPSLLPLYRGPSPIQSAILNGDPATGVTFIKMDDRVDHGPIIDQFEANIEKGDTFESLAKSLFKKAADVLPEILKNYKESNLKPQNESGATYTKLLTKQDGFVDLSNENSLKIENLKLKTRAYYPWPGVWTRFNLSDKEVIIKFLPNHKLQVEGKTPMSYIDFINGYPKGKLFLRKLSLI